MSSREIMQYALGAAPALIQIAIVIAMFRNGSRKRFFMFWTYTIFQILLTGILMVVFSSVARWNTSSPTGRAPR
jgi:sulfite exporter TauE/SafE